MIQYFPSAAVIVDEKQGPVLTVQNQGKGQGVKVRVNKSSVIPQGHKRYIPGYIAVEIGPEDYAKLITK